MRNRVIAALAELVVVVEAGVPVGVAAHGALARERSAGRWWRCPARAGTDGLFSTGARAGTRADDVLAILDGRPAGAAGAAGHPAARRLYEVLDAVPRDVGDLAFRAGLAMGTCAAMVIDLELGGLAARAAGGRYLAH